MRTYIAAITAALASASFNPANAAQTAGQFRLPYNANENGNCDSLGFKRDQYVFEYNSAFKKYHLGEDLNGICGGSTDKGAPVYAIASGDVIYAKDSGINSIGRIIHIRHTLPDNSKVDSVYMHLDSISTNVVEGSPVTAGQRIGTIGDSNGVYSAHLHFEVRVNTTLASTANPYISTLTFGQALKYTSSSLFVDDRSSLKAISLSTASYTYFTVSAHAPTSTAYLQNVSGQRYSINRAVNAGLITGLWSKKGGIWTKYTDVSQIIFEPSVEYAIYSYGSSNSINILTPGHKFKKDRAIIDMARSMQEEGIFTSFDTQAYTENMAWDPNWELRQIRGASALGTVDMVHITYKGNQLVRYTSYKNPQNGLWSAWKPRDQNKL